MLGATGFSSAVTESTVLQATTSDSWLYDWQYAVLVAENIKV
jgi:hypothetical protein